MKLNQEGLAKTSDKIVRKVPVYKKSKKNKEGQKEGSVPFEISVMDTTEYFDDFQKNSVEINEGKEFLLEEG